MPRKSWKDNLKPGDKIWCVWIHLGVEDDTDNRPVRATVRRLYENRYGSPMAEVDLPPVDCDEFIRFAPFDQVFRTKKAADQFLKQHFAENKKAFDAVVKEARDRYKDLLQARKAWERRLQSA